MKAASIRFKGLYALTPVDLTGPALVDAAGQVLSGGAAWLQYRSKPRPDPDTARALAALCRRHGTVFIVNDDPVLAAAVGADGVHLGREDATVAEARALLGPAALIGVSCYADLERARGLADQGADYLAFGSLYPSPTKPDAVRCPPEVLGRARSLGRPVVAIGGITLDRAAGLIAAGADLLAVVSDLFNAPDPHRRAREYAALFD
ncbi:MAG: thiamine phosphate synthase [Wenzhouxiangellaceae bacterium]